MYINTHALFQDWDKSLTLLCICYFSQGEQLFSWVLVAWLLMKACQKLFPLVYCMGSPSFNGSCVLRASAVECQSTSSIDQLSWHSVDIWIESSLIFQTINNNYYWMRLSMISRIIKTEVCIVTQTRGFDNSWYHAKTEFNIYYTFFT